MPQLCLAKQGWQESALLNSPGAGSCHPTAQSQLLLGHRGRARAPSVTLGPAVLWEEFCAHPNSPVVRHLQFLSKILYFLGVGKGR